MHANYTTEHLIEIGPQYAGEGWQAIYHSHGDVAIDSTLDAYEELINRFGLEDQRLRIVHCGLMASAASPYADAGAAFAAGLCADFAVLDVDPRSATSEKLAEARVRATAVDGVLDTTGGIPH